MTIGILKQKSTNCQEQPLPYPELPNIKDKIKQLEKDLKDPKNNDYIRQSLEQALEKLKSKNTNVPAEGPYISSNPTIPLRLKNTLYKDIPYAGTLPVLALEKPNKLQKDWPLVYGLCRQIGLSHYQAMIVRRIIDLQAYSGRCFPSARYLAKELGCNEKTVDRAVAAARDMGLITTTRLSRPWSGSNKTDSVNFIDIRPMWKLLLELLQSCYEDILGRFKKYAGIVHLKMYGAWWPIKEYLEFLALKVPGKPLLSI